MKFSFPGFSKKTTSLLGIDMDSSAIRLTELTRTGADYQLDACIKVPLACDKAHDWQHPLVAAGLKHALQQRKTTTRQAAIALPHTAALFKVVELDKTLTAAEIALQVQQHAQQYFNYPLQELMWDFEILATPARHADLRQIRWVAARRQEVQTRIDALAALDLTTVAVEVDSFSLQRVVATQFTTPIATLALLHFYDTGVLLNIVTHQGLLYMRFEEYAQPVVISGDQSLSTIVTSALRALQMFQHSELHTEISTVLVSGNNNSDALLSTLQDGCGMTTTYLDLSTLCVNSVTVNSAEFAISMGLALRVGGQA